MRTRSLIVAFAGLVAIGSTPARVLGEPAVEPVRRVDPPLPPVPPLLRVEVDGMETIRELRFAGSIVQTIGTEVRASPSEPRTPARESITTRREVFALTGSLPVPTPVQTWFDARAEGQPALRNVSLIATGPDTREMWRWRFSDCSPTQLAYDPDSRTWSLSLTFARLKYENSAPIAAVGVVPPAREGAPASPPATKLIVSEGILRVAMRNGPPVSALRIAPGPSASHVVVTPRVGAPITMAWADIERIEPGRELSSER